MVSKHYARQKQESAARFRVRESDLQKIAGGQYTVFDFIDNAFSFSPAKKRETIRVLEALRERPRSFAELQRDLSLPRSSLYLLLVALQESGLVGRASRERKATLELSPVFSRVLRESAAWWEKWLESAR